MVRGDRFFAQHNIQLRIYPEAIFDKANFLSKDGGLLELAPHRLRYLPSTY